MEKLNLILQIIGKLRPKSDKLQNEGIRYLFVAVLVALGNFVIFGITGAAYLIFGTLAATIAAFYLSASLIIPTTLLIALCIWAVTEYFWSKSKNPILQQQYIDYEFNMDIERLKSLPLGPAKRDPLILERYKKYLADSARAKEMIPLSAREQRQLEERKRYLED